MATLSSKTSSPTYSTIATNLVNFLTNPSDANTWGVSSTGTGAITVATTTTAGALPLGPSVGTAVQIVSATAGTKYVYARFTMPQILTLTKHMFEWFQRQGSGFQTGEWQVDVYYNAASDYTGAYTRVALSTDSSSVTSIPALDGKFTTNFDGPLTTALYYEVRFSRPIDNSPVSAATLNLAQVLVGPGFRPQGAVIQDLGNLTFTTNATAPTTVSIPCWRIGNRLVGSTRVRITSRGGGTARFGMPAGYTIDLTRVTTDSHQDKVVGWYTINTTANANVFQGGYSGAITVDNGDGTFMYVSHTNGADQQNFGQLSWTSLFSDNDRIDFNFDIPIAEWVGNGQINLAQNDVEYVSNSNSNAATTVDNTSFAYGPAGSLHITATPGSDSIARRIRFQTPIQSSDQITIEISPDGQKWMQIPAASSVIVESLRYDGTNYIGAGPRDIVNATDIDIAFGKYRAGTNITWSGFGYWRVVKSKAGAAVGFGEVIPGTAAGLVSANGLKGVSTNSVAPVGYVGEIVSQVLAYAASESVTNSTYREVTASPITLTPGTWDIQANAMVEWASSTNVGEWQVFIGTAAGNNNTGNDHARNSSTRPINMVVGNRFDSLTTPTYRVTIASDTQYFAKMIAYFTVSTCILRAGSIRATRVR